MLIHIHSYRSSSWRVATGLSGGPRSPGALLVPLGLGGLNVKVEVDTWGATSRERVYRNTSPVVVLMLCETTSPKKNQNNKKHMQYVLCSDIWAWLYGLWRGCLFSERSPPYFVHSVILVGQNFFLSTQPSSSVCLSWATGTGHVAQFLLMTRYHMICWVLWQPTECSACLITIKESYLFQTNIKAFW